MGLNNVNIDPKRMSHIEAIVLSMTKEERHLWYDFLRTYKIKFYRQKVIDNYIADFYCREAKLIIELDGSQHYTEQGVDYDRERDAILSGHDLRILRFTNTDLSTRFPAVCQEIDREVKVSLT